MMRSEASSDTRIGARVASPTRAPVGDREGWPEALGSLLSRHRVALYAAGLVGFATLVLATLGVF